MNECWNEAANKSKMGYLFPLEGVTRTGLTAPPPHADKCLPTPSRSTPQKQKQHLLLDESFSPSVWHPKNGSSKESVTISFRALCAEHFVQVAQRGENPGREMRGWATGDLASHEVAGVAHSDHRPHTHMLRVPSSLTHKMLI